MVNASVSFILGLIAIAILFLGLVAGDPYTPGSVTMIFFGLGLLSLVGMSRRKLRTNNLR